MRRERTLTLLLVLTLVFTSISWPTGVFTFTTAEAASSTVTEADDLMPEITDNNGDQNYYVTSSRVYSYLVSVDEGFMRVEYNGTDVVVEYYDSNYALTDKMYVTAELSRFGGFYAGEDVYYLVFGQENYDEDDSVEVIRVVKYSLDWERQGQASLYGANTYVPFNAGCCRLTEYGGYLYIRTCHTMYESSDGLHHQANLTMVVEESDMEIVRANYEVSYYITGYVSHSFNQFILADDEGYIVAADHGDAYPRAAVLFKFQYANASASYATGIYNSVNVLNFEGETGANSTYASIGGLEYSSSSYLLAGNSVTQDENYSSHTARNIFVGVTVRDDVSSSGTSVKWITDYDTDGTVTTSTPQLVKLEEDSFLLMWTVEDSSDTSYSTQSTLNYVFLDGEGNVVSEIYEVEGCLSDCQPILSDGKVVWYVTGGGGASSYDSSPIFYSIDLNGDFSATQPIGTPDISVSVTTEGIEVTWDEVEGAEGYDIYLVYGTNSWSTSSTYRVEDSKTTNYTISSSLVSGRKYYIWVEASAGDSAGYVSEIKGIYYLTPTLSINDEGVNVEWETIDEATSYEIYKKISGKYTKVKTTANTSWTDTDVTGGKTYTYQVRAICDDEIVYSVDVSIVYIAAPKLVSVENGTNGIIITWNTVEGAEKYRVYYSDSYYFYSVDAGDDEQQQYSIWGSSGDTYTIYVVAVGESSKSANSNSITDMYLSRPSLSLTTNDSSISLSWSAVTGANGYKIYRKTESGNYSLVKTTTGTSWTDSSISANTFYTYQVYAYSGNYVSAGSDEKTGGTKDISCCTVTLSETNYTYDGNSKRPTVTVSDGKNELKLYTDYYLTYSNYISAGTATVTITGEGNYTGSTTVNYTIEKADLTLTASIENDDLTVGDTSKITVSSTGTVSYSSSDTSVATVSRTGLVTATGRGTATITVTASGNSNYNPATKTINVTVTDYLTGDVNEDGYITYLDAMAVLRYDAELITLVDAQVLAGDVNADGNVNSLDAIMILRYDAGLISDF